MFIQSGHKAALCETLYDKPPRAISNPTSRDLSTERHKVGKGSWPWDLSRSAKASVLKGASLHVQPGQCYTKTHHAFGSVRSIKPEEGSESSPARLIKKSSLGALGGS